MSKQIDQSGSLTLYPSGYTGLSNLTTTTSYPVTNGYDSSSSTSYARFTLSSGSTGYLYYTFDTSDLPSEATISSITGTVRAYVSSTSRVTSTQCQLYTGTTAKGSNVTFASTSSSNTVTLSPGNSWTVAELSDLRLKIGGTGSSGGGGGGSSRYIYFYGATVVINYTISGTAYTITATSTVSGITPTPATQDIMAGNDGVVTFPINELTLDDYTVTDNGTDVTGSLVRHIVSASGTVSAVPSSTFTTGLSDSNANFYMSSSSTGTTYLERAIGNSAESPDTSTSNTYIKDNDSNTATGWINYTFDFSDIPESATINSVEVRVYGARENSTTDSTHVARLQTYCGDTAKGTAEEFTNTTNSILTLASPGTWTRAELQNAQLRFTIAYYGGRVGGVSWDVSYTVASGETYYWTYTISDIDADHAVVLEAAGAYIPEEEDPNCTYYSLTVSSINATTNPSTGTTRVTEGTNQTITISPTDSTLTLALDNGVDISSQLVGGQPDNTYTVTSTVSGASYGFELNSSTGYYVSNNDGQNSSAAVCRVNFELETSCLVTISYINYAEATYDYGIFGAIDTALGTTYSADSGAYYTCNSSSDNTSDVKTLTYTISSGSHFIDIKYRKDTSTSSNNDSLQWKITSIESTEGGGDYTYTLSNITTNHSLIFVFGSVSYYFVTSSGTNCRLFPDGQLVKLADDSYILNIVPNDYSATVTITDNGVDQSSSLEYLEGTDKEGNTAVSYRYSLSSIAATHTLVVTCSSVSDTLYVKLNGSWVEVTTAYQKVNGTWTEISVSSAFESGVNYLYGGNA